MTKRKFKGFFGHGNEKRNPKPHHLYEIRDKLDGSLYKYGIRDAKKITLHSVGIIDEQNGSL